VYEDGSPGEISIRMANGISIISGLMDSFATVVSMLGITAFRWRSSV
jgi:hypothetical protein